MTAIEHYNAAPAGVDERQISVIERQAAVLARSDLVGDLKGKPADIAVIGMQALALGVPFNAAFSELYVINKKVVLSARIRVALARRAGHEVWFTQTDTEQATCCLRRRGETRIHTLTATIAEATKAGLTKKEVWIKFPADMLRATAARKLVALAAQDVMLGIPGAEMVTTDYDDNDLDVPDDTFELERSKTDAPNTDDAPTLAATADQREDLICRIEALTGDQRAWLLDAAKAANLPNIRGPRFQAGHVETLDALIDAACELDAEAGR